MKAPFILVLLALSVIPSFAQEKPEAPKPNHRIFAIGTSLLAASKSADAFTTRQLLDRGGWENNSDLGKHPSSARLAGFDAAWFVGQSGLFYFTEHNRRAWVRWTGRAYIGALIFNHARLAACNSQINTHSPIAHNCKAFMPF